MFISLSHTVSAQELILKYISESNAALGVSFDDYRPPFNTRMDIDGDGFAEVVMRKEDASGNTTGLQILDPRSWNVLFDFSENDMNTLVGTGQVRVLGFIDLDGNGEKEMLLHKRSETTGKHAGSAAFADTLTGLAISLVTRSSPSLMKVLPERASSGKRATDIQQLSSFTMADLDNDGHLDLLLSDDEAGIVEVWGARTATNVANEELIEANLSTLFQNYPNPFQGRTTIEYEVSSNDQVSIKIYDTLGRQVRRLVDRSHAPGTHNVQWDGKDDGGAPLAAGVYFYQLQAGEYTAAKQMILFK